MLPVCCWFLQITSILKHPPGWNMTEVHGDAGITMLVRKTELYPELAIVKQYLLFSLCSGLFLVQKFGPLPKLIKMIKTSMTKSLHVSITAGIVT